MNLRSGVTMHRMLEVTEEEAQARETTPEAYMYSHVSSKGDNTCFLVKASLGCMEVSHTLGLVVFARPLKMLKVLKVGSLWSIYSR